MIRLCICIKNFIMAISYLALRLILFFLLSIQEVHISTAAAAASGNSDNLDSDSSDDAVSTFVVVLFIVLGLAVIIGGFVIYREFFMSKSSATHIVDAQNQHGGNPTELELDNLMQKMNEVDQRRFSSASRENAYNAV